MSENRLYVQFGCGQIAPEEWRNFDVSLTLRWERIPVLGRLFTKNEKRFPANVEYGDIVKGLPLAPNSCDGMVAYHVLEHLPLNDFRKALANTYSYLKSGGIFRLIVPDMELLCRNYLKGLDAGDRDAVLKLMAHSSLGVVELPNTLLGRLAFAFGSSRHLWMWDFASLSKELEQAGFIRIRRCERDDCEDPAFHPLEHHSRFEHSVAIECRKGIATVERSGSERVVSCEAGRIV